MWTVRLTDAQRDALQLLLAAQGEVGPALGGALEALELARWDELPDAELPWEQVSTLAALQGIDEADVVWDMAAGGRVKGGAVRRLQNGDWYVRGHVPINDLQDYGMSLPVDTDAYNSVGGLVFGELGRLPKRGDMVRVNGYSLRVESVRENRIEAVRIRDHGSEEGAAEAGADDREG